MTEAPRNGKAVMDHAIEQVLTEPRGSASPLTQPPAPTPDDEPRIPRLPASVTQRLAELSAMASGAELAAGAAVDKARERRQSFEEAFTTAILSIGLPGGRNWRVNYNNGEVSEAPAPTPTPVIAVPPGA